MRLDACGIYPLEMSMYFRRHRTALDIQSAASGSASYRVRVLTPQRTCREADPFVSRPGHVPASPRTTPLALFACSFWASIDAGDERADAVIPAACHLPWRAPLRANRCPRRRIGPRARGDLQRHSKDRISVRQRVSDVLRSGCARSSTAPLEIQLRIIRVRPQRRSMLLRSFLTRL